MFNYNGCVCDKCGEKFDTESDVVVCPICGTPHHRECYKELGHCVNEDKHKDGFEWKAPEKAVNFNVIVCPRCQAENPKDAAFCESCGVSLAPQTNNNNTKSQVIGDILGREKTSVVPPILPKALEGECDGVSYKDMAIYIGSSAAYYVYNFKRKQTEGKNYKSFCWSAFFFDGLYFLYRKMWTEAIVILLVSSILSIPSSIMMAQTLGYISSSSPLIFNGIDVLVTVCSLLTFALKAFLGFIAIPRYQKKVVKDLKKIKSQSPSNNGYYQTIVAKSGPSKIVIYACIAIFITYLFM